MTQGSFGTIGQLLCSPTTQVNFARLINDLGAVLNRFGDAAPQLTWDCEDIAFFDMPGTRILLGWTDVIGADRLGCLSVSVGPSPLPAVRGEPMAYEAVCVRLIGRVQERLQPLAIVWHQIEGIAGAEEVDALIDSLPQHLPAAGPLDEEAGEVADAVAGTAEAPAAPHAAEIAEGAPVTAAEAAAEPPAGRPGQPHRPEIFARADAAEKAARATARVLRLRPAAARAPAPASQGVQPWRDPELAAVREQLFAVDPGLQTEPEQPSTQMRLAVHAMNATLIMVYAPLGAAVMTYSILRGEDMRLSARMLTLVGGVGLLLKSPIGKGLVALAGA